MSCGGRDLDDEEDGSLVCLHCGHVSEKIVAEPFARSMALGDRGWMITESSSKQTYKASEMLERMADVLSLPEGKSKAQQALRVMCEYESGCRARSAAWSVRRRLCYAGLAIALKALDDMVEEEHMSTADDELSQLAERVRMRLQQEWTDANTDPEDWIPACHLPAETLPTLQEQAHVKQEDTMGAVVAGEPRHPSRVQGGFAAMRMTQQQIRDHVLQTSDDNPVCERACRRIQEKLWAEPAIGLDEHQPVRWPCFDAECSHVNSNSAEKVAHASVLGMLQDLAMNESICRPEGPQHEKPQGFRWPRESASVGSKESVMEVVAAAALWAVCRRANHALLLSEVVKAIPSERLITCLVFYSSSSSCVQCLMLDTLT